MLLASCGDEVEEPAGDDAREASGEILPGSIDDSMIATDRVRSQPPLLREVPATPSADAATGSVDAEAGSGETPEPATVEEAGLPAAGEPTE
ncbi:hypothetical protein [Alteraurantiacibacter aquimixticola]|nr:hypothetical protein [Alteraurantiacibacter aquimixticola]